MNIAMQLLIPRQRAAVARRILPAVIVAAIAATVSVALLTPERGRFLTVNPSVTQRFVAVPSETSLMDLCYRLRRVQGVTGVSYRNYSRSERSALVTVFYNPQETSVRVPSRPITNSRTSAFGVPAAGYATRCGSRSGCAGSEIHQRRTGVSSGRE